ncbi:MAG: hypothetical protein R3301_13450 [Saprospiraceae bacterium]|nr:hypothetical protein [Saprospiraceae bacterium]
MHWRLVTTLFLLSLSVALVAQDVYDEDVEEAPPRERWMGSVYVDFGIPLRQFERNINDNGLGFGGELLYNVQYQRPVWAGIGVHSFAFDDYSLIYTQVFDGEFFEYRELTASRMFAAHAIFRFQPDVDFIIQPYIQGGFGMHWFFTNTKIEDRAIDELVDQFGENRDSVLGYSLHFGLQYVPRGVPQFRIDLRVGYLRNASVEYMRYNPELGDVDSFPIDYFETRTSAVDILGLHSGVSFMF